MTNSPCPNPERPSAILPACQSLNEDGDAWGFHDAAALCIHEIFEHQARRTPDQLAIVAGDQRVTYLELNERANRLAHHLRSLGVAPDTLVGVYLERGIELVVAILATLKAGGAYLPVDPDCPGERLAFIIRDASTAIVLTQEDLLPKIATQAPAPRLICVDTDGPCFGSLPGTNPPAVAHERNLAYVIYTSGSTGTPKGVLVEHRSVVHLFRATEGLYAFGAEDVWTLFHSAAFDFSVWEMWGALLYGGRLVVVPRSLTRSPEGFYELLQRERVTVLNQTPSAFYQLMRAEQALNGGPTLKLRYVIFGGEALHLPSLRPWFDHHGDVHPRLVNMYGITETTVHVTFRFLKSRDAGSCASGSPVGRPIPGLRVTLLNGAHGPTPAGVVGEILVGGPGVARGYLNRPELTAERFIPDPAGGDPDARLYRSGDLGRLLPDGEIEYIGRNDRQVKLRGFRIELGEIESVLSGHDAVAQCVTVVRHDEPADARLVAYWVRRGTAPTSHAALRAHAAARLPGFMIPAAFVELSDVPLTTNGKVDRKKLPAPADVCSSLDCVHVGPRDALEEQLASLWSHLLGVAGVGVHDNFFELGGHSLLATRAAVRIRSLLDVALPLTALFEQPTVATLARRIAQLRGAHPAPSAAPIPRLDPGDSTEVPMSFAQQGLWFLHQLDDGLTAYHISETWRLDGPLDVAALGRALETIVERHAPLRTTFRMANGKDVQLIGMRSRLVLSVHNLRALAAPAQSEEAARLVREDADRPFDLTNDSLLRATLLALREEEHILRITLHHMASDGWSQAILRRELEALYGAYRHGRPPRLAELPVAYADYTVWQQHSLHAQRLGELLAYWRGQLADLPTLELPTDRPRPARFSYCGAEHAFSLPQDLTAQLRALGQASDATLQMTLLAAYLTLLSRLSGQVDLAVGTLVAGRNHVDVEDLIGLFVNMLVLRVDLAGDPTFRALLDRVRRVSLEAYDHQELPFEMLVEDLHPVRQRSRGPLVQVMFQLMQFEERPPSLDGLAVTRLADPGQGVRFDLELHLWQDATGLRGTFAYSTDLFDAATIERMAGYYATLLESVVASPGCRLSELPLLAAAQCDQLLLEWSGAATESELEKSIHELFEAQAARAPDAMAIVYGGSQLTYGQLDQRANQLAQRLRTLGVERETRVGVYLERSAELVVAMLGILKAGGAYVPLDLDYPRQRLEFMMQDACVEIVVTEERLRRDLPQAMAQVVCLDQGGAEFASPAGVSPTPAVDAASLAYVMYTSGSTGQPSGVSVPHRAVTRLVRDTNYLALNPADRVAQAASASFDAATFEIWGALLSGAQVVGLGKDVILAPPRLKQELRERGITVMFVTTALFNQLAAVEPGVFAALRCLLFGGEAVDPGRVRSVLECDPPGRLVHVYGPTENTTFSTFHDVARVPAKAFTVPIGQPIANTTCYVLDDGCRPVPVGVAGELYLGGAGLARGYLNRPGLTAERFIASPFQPGQRLYRTGDRVRWSADGTLEFLGRRDHQVKLRGHRIELGEIEYALREHEGVEQCKVLLQEDGSGLQWLAAYWVPRPGGAATAAALRDHLRDRLPDFMVPGAFVSVSALPLTANGKLDHAALPPPRGVPTVPDPGAMAVRTPLEQALTESWAKVLGVERAELHDNFFEAGGHSLLALRLISEIEQGCGRHVSLATLLAHPTIAALAGVLESQQVTLSPCSIVELRRGGSRPPLYFPPGLTGEGFRCDAVMKQLPPDQPVYAIEDRTRTGAQAQSLEAMALYYCEELKTFQPEGPLFLAGYSFSGLLAYEMARNLVAQRRDVRLLAIIDTGPGGTAPRGPADALDALWLFLRNLPRWIPDTLLGVPAGEMLSYARRALGKLFKVFLIKHRGIHPFAPELRADDLFDTNDWPEPLRARVNDNLRAFLEFCYRPYHGRVVLFRTRTRPLFHAHERDLGWGRFVLGQLEIVHLAGNHVTIFNEPYVRELARGFRAALEAAGEGD